MNSHKDLNQIFYNYNKFDSYIFDSPTDILRLEPLFFSLSNHETELARNKIIEFPKPIDTSNDNKETKVDVEHEKNNINTTVRPIPVNANVNAKVNANANVKRNENVNENPNKKWFEPLQKDTIFWCIFAFIYGHTEYLMIGSRYGNRELEEKGKMIAYFNESKKQLKNVNHKITNGNIQEIMSEFLALQNETTFLGMVGLVSFYKIRVLLVDETKNLYIDFHMEDMPETETETKTCILYKNTTVKGTTVKGKCQIKYRMNMELDSYEDEISRIQTNMLRLEHFTKPLRAISSYKLCELEEIAKMIGLFSFSSTDKLKKPELYARITEYCNWNTNSV